MKTAEDWIRLLDLKQHPEGGYFRETYRSDEVIELLPIRYEGTRNISTSIYYLLKGSQHSAFHKLKSDEIWHFYYGCPLNLYIIDNKGKLLNRVLGQEIPKGERLQVVIQREQWFAARPLDPASFSLLGCTVAPGFDFRDFEMGQKNDLINNYPQYRDLIKKLT